MSFETYFKASSYAMISCAMLALMLAGGLHFGLGLAFVVVVILAWKAEGSHWQLSERVGLVIVLISIPLFFLTGTTSVPSAKFANDSASTRSRT